MWWLAGVGARRRALFGVALVAMTSAMTVAPGVTSAASGGSISGVVVDGDTPLAGICVGVDDRSWTPATDATGAFEIGGVEPGEHAVYFSDCNTPPTYLSMWFGGSADRDKATPVMVVDGEDAPLGNVTMRAGVRISGTVTGGALPLEGISVNVNPYDGVGVNVGTTTGPDGTYVTEPVPDGDYRVQFNDGTGAFATQYWNGEESWNGADRLEVSVADGEEHGRVDASMASGGAISGTVTGAGGPAEDICVSANIPDGDGGYAGLNGAQTGQDGRYLITGLPVGRDIRVSFHDCNPTPIYVDEWFDDVTNPDSATSIVLAAGQERTGVDAVLATGVTVAGTVIDASGEPIEGISVNVNPTEQGNSGWGQTDAEGHYVTTPVAPGSYRVQFRDDHSPARYASQYWEQRVTAGSATVLVVDGSEPQYAGVDARLDEAAIVAGTVTDSLGNGVGAICVDLVTQTDDGLDGIDHVETGRDGTYAFERVPATAILVRFEDCHHVGPYATVWWQDAVNAADATALDPTPGQARTDVDQQLVRAASISGTVTDGEGHPVGGVCVQAVTPTAFGALTGTGEDGAYDLLLDTAGDYTVQFFDCRELPSLAGRTLPPIHVESGEAVAGADVALDPGATATISGSVRNGAGTAVTGACAVAYIANAYVLFGPVAADGTFTITGAPSGTYAIGFVGCGDGGSPTIPDPTDPAVTYQAQWWHGVDMSLVATGDGGPDPIAQGANLVAVAPGAALTGFDVCLGCAPPPTNTTTTTTTTTTSPANPTSPSVAVTITGLHRSPGTIAVSFTADEVDAGEPVPLQLAAVPAGTTFTATCTSASNGSTAVVSGTSTELTVAGVDDRASYSCVVVALIDGVVVGRSAAESIGPLVTAELPATGTSPGPTLVLAGLLVVAGAVTLLVRRRARH